MSHPPKDILLANARRLRRDMTPWERKLWYLFLRKYPVKIYRQHIISPYIADFYCPKAKLVIELDGSQHFMPVGLGADARRDAAMAAHGISVLRIPNIDIERRFQAVCETIHREIQSRT